MTEQGASKQFDPEAAVRRVHAFIEARGLLQPGPLVVAVSGGQDSVCMLDVLLRLAGLLRLDLHVAHLNHSFRGAEAEAEAEHVSDLARRLGIPATIATIDVPSFRTRHRLSKPVAARYARYQFIAGLADRLGSEQVAVGHTADDAIESLLMNLLRGAGLAGLRGIDHSRQLSPGQLGPGLLATDWKGDEYVPGPRLPRIVRPILPLFRAETEAYCLALGLPYESDPSNRDVAYRRNWIREKLLPLLEQQEPAVRERLSSAAELLAADYHLIGQVVQSEWARLAKVRKGGVELSLHDWGELDVALRRHLLRRAVEEVAGSLEEWGRIHLDSMDATALQGPPGAHLDLPGGVRLEREYESLMIALGTASTEPALPESPIPIPVPDRILLPGGVLEAGLLDTEGWAPGAEGPCAGDPFEACLDADRVGPNPGIRRRRAGDRLVPLGMKGEKKLHDFMVDEKIPRAERDRVPLVVSSRDEIAWVVGHRVDERFKVVPETRRILRLRYMPEGALSSYST